MCKRYRIIALFIFCATLISAQNKLNTSDVDEASLGLFQQKKWTELIVLSKEAQNQGIDFFSLQTRTGIAYYNLKKYRKSSEYLLKAWDKDRSFNWLQQYLYYSLILSGRVLEANTVAKDFTADFQKTIHYAPKKATRIAVEGGYGFNPDFDALSGRDFNSELNSEGNYGEAFLFKNYHFESIDLSHMPKPGISINHNFTYLGSNYQQLADINDHSSFETDISQFQYFLNPVFLLGHHFHLSPSLTLIGGRISYQSPIVDYNSYNTVKNSYFDAVFTTTVWAHYGNFSPGAELSFANIYDEGFTQLSTWLSIYPFSNVNLYFAPRVYFKRSSNESLSINTVGISGGIQLGKIHVTGQYLNGDMENFVEQSGYVISNFPGKSAHKFTGAMYIPIGKKTQFIFRYLNQEVTESYKSYSDYTEIESIDYSYIKHTLILGLSWDL